MRIISFGHAALLVDTGTERILVDPWLTQRLDRFWERLPGRPAGLDEELHDIDAIVFTHHHFDHHHFPSLAALSLHLDADFDETLDWRAKVRCLYPRGQGVPQFTASGLGHQAIAWTLRRLGFTHASAVTPGDTVRIGESLVRTFPSRVPFPEMSLYISGPSANVMLCGDAMLHPAVVEAFGGPDAPRVDLALIPAHSVAPPGVLTERRAVGDAAAIRARAQATFERYVEVLDPAVTVPSSFGWRVRGSTVADGADASGGTNGADRSYDWANRTLFPFTPVEAAGRLAARGRNGLLCGPGQVLTVEGGETEVADGPYLDKSHDFESLYAQVALEPATEVPAFDPAVDRVGVQRDDTGTLAHKLAEELVGTDYWYRSAESGQTHSIEIDDDGGTHTYVLDLIGRRVITAPSGEHGVDGGYTRIAASTLQSLFDSDLLFGSSYGLWVSTENLLSAVFHHPRFYVRHVEKAL